VAHDSLYGLKAIRSRVPLYSYIILSGGALVFAAKIKRCSFQVSIQFRPRLASYSGEESYGDSWVTSFIRITWSGGAKKIRVIGRFSIVSSIVTGTWVRLPGGITGDIIDGCERARSS
jgi:hypothetical protein